MSREERIYKDSYTRAGDEEAKANEIGGQEEEGEMPFDYTDEDDGLTEVPDDEY